MVDPKHIIREEILALEAYHVPPSEGMVKLDAMENPYPLPPQLKGEVGRLAASAPLNRYPDPSAAALKRRLREFMAVPQGMELLLGNGSDELIQILAMAAARPGAVLMSVEPTFVMFRVIATYTGMDYLGVPLGPDFELDPEPTLAAIRERRPALVFLAYPNNPTGNLFDPAVVSRIIEAAPGIVVVDEAYSAFAQSSMLDRLPRHGNLLVMRTLSKLGLAGLRLGVLIGRREWIEQLDKLRLPYNVNVLTQAVAENVLQQGGLLLQQAAQIRAAREELFARLKAMPAVQVFPSKANFLLFRVSDAEQVFTGLKARGILIKKLHGSHPRLAGCLRVTVGTPEENRQFLQALEQSLPRAAGAGMGRARTAGPC